jgi:tetratricopeptide (TPR) repeat protein
LSKLSGNTIDELVRFGLLDPRGGLFGFRDLAGARQISKLFEQGIALSEIIRSVKEVRAWLPEADLSNLRLHPGTHHTIEIEQAEGRTDKRGQFVLPATRPGQNADVLFEQAQAAEETGNIAEAERLYGVLMKCDPTDAAAPFNLGNMLRADGRKVEAEAALRAATRADPMFAEAWYNLSDLLDEQGRSEAAIDCLRKARYEPRRPTLMRYSISHSCFNEATSTRKLRNTGDNISPRMLNPNGQRGRGGP